MKNLSKIFGLMTKTFKVLMINTTIFSLIQPELTLAANMTNANTNNGGFGASDIMNIANGALGVYANYLGMKQQIMQQQISAIQNQKLMAQLGPSCRRADGTACFTSPAKFFPECTLPASMSNMPNNICTNPTPEPAQISSMLTYESIAQGWMNYYDQMSNEASNASYPTGLRCLYDKQKALDSKLIEMSNSLQRLQDRLNQDKQVFRDSNKKLLEDMNTANDELFGAGGASKNNLKIKTQDFAKFFSQSCQSVVGKDALKTGATNGGLNGILQGLSSTNKAAADLNLNRNVIEDEVRREANRISTSITANGIDDFLSNGNTQNNIKSANYPSIESTVQKQASEFNTARARIIKELAAVGYTPPAMDKNFSVDMNDFSAGSADFFKKKYVNDCVTGAGSGIAIPIEDILNSLEQKSTQSAGTARNDYRIALKKILDSDAMMDAKMVSIRELQAKYPDITITYKDSSQARITESPYDLFMKTIEKCQQRYVQDDQFSSKGSSGVSYQKKVERGRAALLELKNLNESFASKITQAIANQVLSCDDKPMKAGSDCNEATLQTTDPNFCVAHASVCANNIQGCYAEANTQVQTRKTKMENLAKTFNANVASMVARSNALFEQQKAAVTSITQMIQSKFPGTNFDIPKDMFVSMPELSKDAYGVEMAGNGDLKSFLDGENSMPSKIEKLKQIFKSQRETVKASTDEYINLQKEAMTREKGRWNELYGKCKSAIDSSTRELQKMNAEGQKKQMEDDQNVAKFCKKYNSISQNPVGACGKAKDLADSVDQIQARISSQAQALTEQYASACDGFMNESNTSSQMCSTTEEGKVRSYPCPSGQDNKLSALKKTRPIKISTLCGSGSSLKQDSEFIASIANKLSFADKEKLSGVSSFESAMKKVDEDSNFNDGNFFNNIADLIADDNSNSSICKKIKDIVPSNVTLTNEVIEKKIAEQELIKKDKSSEKDAKDQVEKADKEIKSLQRQAQLNDALSELAEANKEAADPTSKETQVGDIQRIGEQIEGPCDMQSNSNVGKSTGFDLNSFDASVLGAARIK